MCSPVEGRGFLLKTELRFKVFICLSLEMVTRPPASTRPVPYTLYTLSLDLCAKTINILTAHFIHFLEINVSFGDYISKNVFLKKLF